MESLLYGFVVTVVLVASVGAGETVCPAVQFNRPLQHSIDAHMCTRTVCAGWWAIWHAALKHLPPVQEFFGLKKPPKPSREECREEIDELKVWCWPDRRTSCRYTCIMAVFLIRGLSSFDRPSQGHVGDDGLAHGK
jgi:hypothetical protein